jgi:hypothetical protein
MSKQKHTPGPWMSFDSGTLVITESPSSLLIAILEGCEVETIAEIQANANLIAASPDLLAYCKAMFGELQLQGVSDQNDEMQRIAATIAKAEGRS